MAQRTASNNAGHHNCAAFIHSVQAFFNTLQAYEAVETFLDTKLKSKPYYLGKDSERDYWRGIAGGLKIIWFGIELQELFQHELFCQTHPFFCAAAYLSNFYHKKEVQNAAEEEGKGYSSTQNRHYSLARAARMMIVSPVIKREIEAFVRETIVPELEQEQQRILAFFSKASTFSRKDSLPRNGSLAFF
jgi:hypothetical protein